MGILNYEPHVALVQNNHHRNSNTHSNGSNYTFHDILIPVKKQKTKKQKIELRLVKGPRSFAAFVLEND